MSNTKLTPRQKARIEKEYYEAKYRCQRLMDFIEDVGANDMLPSTVELPSININLQRLIGKLVISTRPSPEGNDLPILPDSEIERLESTVSEAVLKALGSAIEQFSSARQAEGK